MERRTPDLFPGSGSHHLPRSRNRHINIVSQHLTSALCPWVYDEPFRTIQILETNLSSSLVSCVAPAMFPLPS